MVVHLRRVLLHGGGVGRVEEGRPLVLHVDHLHELGGLRRERRLAAGGEVGGADAHGVGGAALKVEGAAEADHHHVAAGGELLRGKRSG